MLLITPCQKAYERSYHYSISCTLIYIYLLYEQVYEMEGVLQVHDPHFWTLCSGSYMGSLRLEVLPNTDTARIVAGVRSILKQVGITQVTIEITVAD